MIICPFHFNFSTRFFLPVICLLFVVFNSTYSCSLFLLSNTHKTCIFQFTVVITDNDRGYCRNMYLKLPEKCGPFLKISCFGVRFEVVVS